MNFDLLEQMVAELNSTNSKNDKINILKKYPQCKKILQYVYDPLKKFNVTSATVKKHIASGTATDFSDMYSDLFILLDGLNARTISGHDALNSVGWFISQNNNHADIIYKIIDKNLEVRIDDKSINKVWPDLIPTFDVALAKSYEDHIHQVDFKTQNWFASHKLDGCLDETTIVEFEDGSCDTIKHVYDEKIDKKIKCYNHNNNQIEYKKIVNYMKNGIDVNEKQVTWFKVKTKSGREIILTGNHKVFLNNIGCYRRTDELSVGDVFYTDK